MIMNIWHDISPNRITKENFYAVIEIQKGSKMKYELDKKTGFLLPGLVSVTPSIRTSPTGRWQARSQKRNRSRKSRPYFSLSKNQEMSYGKGKAQESHAETS